MKPKLKIRTTFEWKRLTEDGLLKPITNGDRNWTETLCGGNTREEAYGNLLLWGQQYRDFILIEVCDLVEDDHEDEI